MNEIVDDVLDCDRVLYDHPALKDIKTKLAGAAPFQFSEYVPLFKELMASGFLNDAVTMELDRIVASPYAQLPSFSISGSVKVWVFAVSKHFSMSLNYYNKSEKSHVALHAPEVRRPRLQPNTQDIFLGFMHTDGGSCRVYGTERFSANEPLAAGTALELQQEIKIQKDACISLRAGIDVPFLKMDQKAVYLEIAGVVQNQFGPMPQFDAETLKLIGWIDADVASSRYEFLTRLLVELGQTSAIPDLLPLTKHEYHNVRWQTIRHIMRLDARKGLALAREALSDPHIHVRQAAQATLDKFNNLEQR